VHTLYKGSYVVDLNGERHTFWIGPLSTTLPFAFLACLFLAHCQRYRRRVTDSTPVAFARPAYWGATLAWLSMMGFTLYLTSQAPGPETSSTMGIAVMLTPLFYLPLLILPYIVGAIAGRIWGSGAVGKALSG
jgi:hypothetical protein